MVPRLVLQCDKGVRVFQAKLFLMLSSFYFIRVLFTFHFIKLNTQETRHGFINKTKHSPGWNGTKARDKRRRNGNRIRGAFV